MLAGRRKIRGDLVKTIYYDCIGDISSKIGWTLGTIIINSHTEYVNMSVEKAKVEVLTKLSLKAIQQHRAVAHSVRNQHQTISAIDELKKFKDLLDAGIITQAEFDAKKKQLLGL